MNALTSYIRHLIVTGIVFLVGKMNLPVEGAEDAANVVALAVVGTLTWAVVKYGAALRKWLLGSGDDTAAGGGLKILVMGLVASVLFPSCAALPEGVFSGVSVRVKTEHGVLTADENGLGGEISVDLTSGK